MTASGVLSSSDCLCGCGAKTRLAPCTDATKGWVKGQPLRYVKGHNKRRRLDSYVIDPETGCWLWTGRISADGYAVITRPRGSTNLVHRLLFELYRGPIPAALQLDHLCHSRDNACLGGRACVHRRCVNPDHLEPVTLQENIRRGVRARQTHCVHGHPLDAGHARIDARGHRHCRLCKNLSAVAAYQKKRAS